MKRYKKVLCEFRRGKNLRSSHTAVGVDRNTVVASAAITELAIVAWANREELLPQPQLRIFIRDLHMIIEGQGL